MAVFKSRKHEIIRLYKDGATTWQICRDLQLTQEAVRSCIRANEIAERLSEECFEPHPELPIEWHQMPLTYFIYALGAHAVKIGFTQSGLAHRLCDLSVGSPFELIPCAVILGDRLNERTAHRHLCQHWIRGEWYESNDAVWSYAAKIGVFVYQHWIEPAEGLRPCIYRDEDICERPSAHQLLVRRSIRDAFNGSRLNQKEREIIRLRLGLSETCEELTLEEVGKRLKLTRERVRQLEKRGLQKLSEDRLLRDLAS